jgi:hypothetical protein
MSIMANRSWIAVVVCACASLFSVLVTSDANACINVTRAEMDRHVALVQSSQAALDNGEPRRAIALLDNLPSVRGMLMLDDDAVNRDDLGMEFVRDKFLVFRMRRIYALALARSRPRTLPGQSPSNDLQTAVRMIQRAVDIAKKDGEEPEPSLWADWAEVMAAAGYDKSAAPILRWLAVGDLMGNAHAYAALARIETAAGNTEAATLATERCKKMAKQKSICVAH